MWGWFGGSGGAQARKDAPKKAILALRQQLDMLQKREKHLENQMAEQDAIARKNVSSNKTGMRIRRFAGGVRPQFRRLNDHRLGHTLTGVCAQLPEQH